MSFYSSNFISSLAIFSCISAVAATGTLTETEAVPGLCNASMRALDSRFDKIEPYVIEVAPQKGSPTQWAKNFLERLKLDRGFKTTPLDKQETKTFKELLEGPRDEAKVLEKIAERFGLEKRLNESAGVIEGYSVRAHTMRVMKNLENQWPFFAEETSSPNAKRLLGLLRAATVLHDIGKGEAVRNKKKDLQHQYTEPILKSVIASLGYSKKERDLVNSLVLNDVIGEYLKDGSIKPEAAVEKLEKLAEEADLPLDDFFPLQKFFYSIDASSYDSLSKKLFAKSDDGRLTLKDKRIAQLESAVDQRVMAKLWNGRNQNNQQVVATPIAPSVNRMFEKGPGVWVQTRTPPAANSQWFVRGLTGGAFRDKNQKDGKQEAMAFFSGTRFPYSPMVSEVPAGTTNLPITRSPYPNPVAVIGTTRTPIAPFKGKLNEGWIQAEQFSPNNIMAVGLFFPESPQTYLGWGKAYLGIAQELQESGMKIRPGSRGAEFIKKLSNIVAKANSKTSDEKATIEAFDQLFKEYDTTSNLKPSKTNKPIRIPNFTNTIQ